MADQTNSTAFRDLLADKAAGLYYFATLHSAITGLTLNMTYAATGISELATGNGYTLGGAAVSLTHTGGTGGNLDAADEVFTASGGDIGPASYYAIWCNTTDTITGAKCIAIKDSSSSPQTATDGNDMTIAVANLISIPTPA